MDIAVSFTYPLHLTQQPLVKITSTLIQKLTAAERVRLVTLNTARHILPPKNICQNAAELQL
jgi:hypothetical protein